MKRDLICILLLLSMLAALLSGCGETPAPESSEAPASEDASTTLPPEPEPETEPDTAHAVSYDEASGTLLVSGTGDYDRLRLPEAVDSAGILQVEDDEFLLALDLDQLRSGGTALQTELPGIVDRTEKSFRFLRDYLQEHAPSVFPEKAAGKTVDLYGGVGGYGHYAKEDRIVLSCFANLAHRDYQYLLELMGQKVGWEQLGYGWYLGVCKNPYCELPLQFRLTRDLPYYQACVDAGVDPEHTSYADIRVVFDAVSAVDFKQGLTGWGSACESRPVNVEPDYTRIKGEPIEKKLTAFMAASFLAWLEDGSDFETVSRFCFGQTSFSEAFGMEASEAYEAWKQWIVESYPNV